MASTFNFVSFIIGGLIFSIITLLLVWIAYFSRIFMFTYCPSQAPVCHASDYFNNPGDAIANGANVGDILFIDKKGQMVYKRVPKTSNCIPGTGQAVVIPFPQYCSFTNDSGVSGTYRDSGFNTNTYYPVSGDGSVVITSENCTPVTSGVQSGTILLQWDANPITS